MGWNNMSRSRIGIFLMAVWLLAGTAIGQQEYVHVYNQIQVNYQYFGFAKMAASPEGGWVVAECDSATRVVRVLRFDACSRVRWAKQLTYPLSFRPYRVSDILVDSDGTIMLGVQHFGTNQGAFHMTRLDDSGEVIWTRLWGATNFGPGVFQMGFLPERRIFFVGLCNPTGLVSDMVGIVDSTGNLQQLRRYYSSAAGYAPSAIALKNDHILIRRGDRLYEVDPGSGDVVWMTWNIAPLYNSVIPVELDSGFLILGQFSNSQDLYSAVPVFLDEQGAYVSRGEMFRADGGAFSNVENLRIRRVVVMEDGHFVTVTTDSLKTGYLSVVIFDAIGDLVRQIYINPEPGKIRLLNHDFCLLPDNRLAIAANINGALGMVLVRLDSTMLCGAREVLQPVPYNTSISSGSIDFQGTDYPVQAVSVELLVQDFDPGLVTICDTILNGQYRRDTLTACPGDSVLADASWPGATDWIWSNGAQVSNQYIGTGDSLQVEVSVGCLTLVRQFVCLPDAACPCPVSFPNLFTPNGDGVNDHFRPVTDCLLEDYSLTVYSRWGHPIFSTRDPHSGWDGKQDGVELPMEVYSFVASWTDDNGTSGQVRGDITLVR